MPLLTNREKASASMDVQSLVAAHGETATRLAPPATSGPYGDDEGPFTPAGQFPVERVQTPQIVLDRNDVDAVFSIPLDAVLEEGDRMEVAGVLYRVLSVVPKNLFGSVTHQVVEAALVHGGTP